MAWAGTGVLCRVNGGILTLARARPDRRQPRCRRRAGTFNFVQISDSHIGFQQAGQPRCGGDLSRDDRAHQRAARTRPNFILHTGDLTHLAEADGIRRPRSRC